jgi:rSAM/selenodomain-associated transferase 1
MQDETLIVFLKAPRPGAVKTRLAEALGAEAACAAYRQLVQTLLRRLAVLSNVELCFTPDDAAAEINPWAHQTWSLVPQGDGDLGRRLQRASTRAFTGGAQRVVIIGSDCPEVSATDIEAAWSALRTHDVVLGPATDGGYWLVGLRRAQPDLFTRISWSTGAVLRETFDRARAASLSVHLLRELGDVDTLVDWQQFLAQAT